MKKYMLLIFLCAIGVHEESFAQGVFVSASSRLVPSYDVRYDNSKITDSVLVITVKTLWLPRIDNLEKIFSVKFESLPYVKFGLPDDLTRYEFYNADGAYYAEEKAIYLTSAIDHLIAVRLGTTDKDEVAKERARKFDSTSAHELGHWTHDVVLRRRTNKILKYEYFRPGSKSDMTAGIEYEVTAEGVAKWTERKCLGDTRAYISVEDFPDFVPAVIMDIWWEYACSFVGPILDVDAKRGLEYLVDHPFRIDTSFMVSAREYQQKAIEFLKNKKGKEKKEKKKKSKNLGTGKVSRFFYLE